MNGLEKANAARLDAALDKQWRFKNGISTFRALIEAGEFDRAEVGETPLATWNRRKFNRMDQRQQAEYQRKMDTTKPEYRLFRTGCPHGSWVPVPKMVFDWAAVRIGCPA